MIIVSFTAEPPKFTHHPQAQKDAIPEKSVAFTVDTSGTQPLKFHWEWKPSTQSNGWQSIPLDVERFQGADTATLTITRVLKSDEGEYRCTVSNCAGSETSNSAALTIGNSIPSCCMYAVHIRIQQEPVYVSSCVYRPLMC